MITLLLNAYLIGTIPFGLLLTKLAGKGDIRQTGSGNIGATNVLRSGSKKLALLTLLLDAGKGYVAVYLASIFAVVGSHGVHEADHWLAFGLALAAIAGHCFPIWLKFKGGKGVATAFGALFALSPYLGLLCGATWLVVFAASRYSSLAALIAMALMPFYAYVLKLTPLQLPSLILASIATLIILRHRSNIKQLIAGTEHKFGAANTTDNTKDGEQ